MSDEDRISLARALEDLASTLQACATPRTVEPGSHDSSEADRALVTELGQAAYLLRAGHASLSWVESTRSRARKVGNSALDTAISAATAAAIKHYAG